MLAIRKRFALLARVEPQAGERRQVSDQFLRHSDRFPAVKENFDDSLGAVAKVQTNLAILAQGALIQ